MSNLAKRLVKGAGIVFIMTMLNTFFGFMVRIVLARNLTLEDFGFFYAVIAFLGLVGLLKNLGVNQAIIKFIPDFLVQKDFGKVKTSILFSLGFSITTSAVVVSALYYFSNEIATGYFKDPNVETVFRIFLVFFVVQLLVSSISSIFNAFQRPILLSYSGVFINLFFFIPIYFSDKLDISRVAWYYNGVHMVVLVTNIVLLLNVFNIFRYQSSGFIPVVKKLIPFGAATTASTIVSHTTMRVDTIFLTYFQDLKTVGIYSVLTPFRTIFKVAGSSISKIFFPMTSELYGQGKTKELINTLKMIQKYIILLMMPFTVVFFAYTEFIIEALYGVKFVEGVFAARLIVLASIIQPIYIVNVGTINGLGKPMKNTQIITITGIINFLLNMILIPIWSYNGAAIAVLLNKIIVFAVTNIVIYRLIGFRFDFYLILKVLLAGAAMYIFLVFAKTCFYDTILWLAIVQYIAASILGLVVYLALCFPLKAATIDEVVKMSKLVFKR
ncbi:MAG: oligosaccharide flippase family protein [Deltaproteobacteria bacterium]|uniref:Oligosaccharide flippase family protein n=1 Tax=Candidatus Zymogenus saltonus TaxID=2844893 RepID=A0A9D8KG18_9DELT|nr:oligosaccharide flippase family protein [Candidatus Zymogenus saltonus]